MQSSSFSQDELSFTTGATIDTLEYILERRQKGRSKNDDESVVSIYIDDDESTVVAANSSNHDRQEKDCDESSTSQPDSDIDDGIVEALRTSVVNGQIDENVDPSVVRCVKLFKYGHKERRNKYTVKPYSILGLFSNISDIRSDLLWAQDAVHRQEHGKPYISWEDYYNKQKNGLVRPFFAYTFVVICSVLLVWGFYLNNWKIEPMNVNPLVGPNPEMLLTIGALETRQMIENNEWWRLLTPAFLHGGIIHFVVNMIFFWFLCRAVERNHGTVITGTVFLLSAVSANIISALMQPGYILVGASGGIFALFGICLADIIMNWKLLFLVFDDHGDEGGGFCLRFRCKLTLILDISLNAVVGFTPWVDNFAHLGGLFYGFCLSCLVLKRLPTSFFQASSSWWQRLRVLALRFSGAGLAFGLMVLSALLLMQSDGTQAPCPDCRYISCIPFPFWMENKWWHCDDCATVEWYVYRKTGEEFYNRATIICPQGNEADIDLSTDQISSMIELSRKIPDYCRAECYLE